MASNVYGVCYSLVASQLIMAHMVRGGWLDRAAAVARPLQSPACWLNSAAAPVCAVPAPAPAPSRARAAAPLPLQAKEPYAPYPWTYVLVGLGALNSSLQLLPGWHLAAVLVAVTVAMYLHYVTSVVAQVCAHLGIQCFVISPAPRPRHARRRQSRAGRSASPSDASRSTTSRSTSRSSRSRSRKPSRS